MPPEGLWRVKRHEEVLANTNHAIKIILRLGGMPVLAHPGEHRLKEEDIKEMADAGLKGIELYTPKHTPQEIEYYGRISEKYKLFVTSGTDFHDPYHRARVKPGYDRNGDVLIRGVSIKDLKEMLHNS